MSRDQCNNETVPDMHLDPILQFRSSQQSRQRKQIVLFGIEHFLQKLSIPGPQKEPLEQPNVTVC
jgi:hypothetical protein